MESFPIPRMLERARQLRRIAAMAHDEEMSGMLSRMAAEIEADVARLEAELKAGPKTD